MKQQPPWYRGADSLVQQAARQTEAAVGTTIVWSVAEEPAADAVRHLLEQEGVSVVHVPPR